MSQPPLAFFTVDHGRASTSAALIARLDGRWRLLGSGAVPAAVPDDLLLQDVVARVRRTGTASLPDATDAQTWGRLETTTAPPGHCVVVAGSERRLASLEAIFADAGWSVAGRITPERSDPLAATEALLAPNVRLVAIASGEPAGADERSALPDLCALVAAAAERRPDLQVLLAGGVRSEAGRFPPDHLLEVRAPARGKRETNATAPEEGSLADVARRLAHPPEADGRIAFVQAIASLAVVLDRRVEGIDIGLEAGTRVLADPDGVLSWIVRAEAALAPPGVMHDQHVAERIVAWSPLRQEPYEAHDHLRNLRLAPWRDADGDGARLRLAAARAALERLQVTWGAEAAQVPEAEAAPDLLVLSGGAFAVAPPPAVALAAIDTLRRPGAMALALDHARALAPLGAVEEEHDRLRLFADLADDLLLPLGSAILAAGWRGGRRSELRVTSQGVTTELPLPAGTVQVVDLPPGQTAMAELAAAESFRVGPAGRRVSVEVVGGLGGLLVDTRDIPLRLPDHRERRRSLLEAWQRPLWTGGEA